MFGLFFLHKATQVSDNIDSQHAQFAREKKARIKANPTSGEALGQGAKTGAGAFALVAWLVTAGIMAIGHGTFGGSLISVPVFWAVLIAAPVGAIVGVLVALADN